MAIDKDKYSFISLSIPVVIYHLVLEDDGRASSKLCSKSAQERMHGPNSILGFLATVLVHIAYPAIRPYLRLSRHHSRVQVNR